MVKLVLAPSMVAADAPPLPPVWSSYGQRIVRNKWVEIYLKKKLFSNTQPVLTNIITLRGLSITKQFLLRTPTPVIISKTSLKALQINEMSL